MPYLSINLYNSIPILFDYSRYWIALLRTVDINFLIIQIIIINHQMNYQFEDDQLSE